MQRAPAHQACPDALGWLVLKILIFHAAVLASGLCLGGAAAASPVGSLWHSYSDLSNPEGTFATDVATGQTRRLAPQKWGTPWPDGSRILWRSHSSQGSRGDETRIVVRRADSQQVLADQVVDGYVGDDVRPAPTGSNAVLVQWGPALFDDRGPVVYDLDSRRLLYVTRPSPMPDALSWMPDGSLLRLQPSGQISRVVLGAAEQPLATVRWPEGRWPRNVHVSPDGSKAIVELAALRDSGKVSGVDLWMMDVNGQNLRRFTRNNLIAQAFWSPDGRHVGFVKDTGMACGDASCRGSCTVWMADASAADVVAVKASNDALEVPLRRPNGTMTRVGCPVSAWTR